MVADVAAQARQGDRDADEKQHHEQPAEHDKAIVSPQQKVAQEQHGVKLDRSGQRQKPRRSPIVAATIQKETAQHEGQQQMARLAPLETVHDGIRGQKQEEVEVIHRLGTSHEIPDRHGEGHHRRKDLESAPDAQRRVQRKPAERHQADGGKHRVQEPDRGLPGFEDVTAGGVIKRDEIAERAMAAHGLDVARHIAPHVPVIEDHRQDDKTRDGERVQTVNTRPVAARTGRPQDRRVMDSRRQSDFLARHIFNRATFRLLQDAHRSLSLSGPLLAVTKAPGGGPIRRVRSRMTTGGVPQAEFPDDQSMYPAGRRSASNASGGRYPPEPICTHGNRRLTRRRNYRDRPGGCIKSMPSVVDHAKGVARPVNCPPEKRQTPREDARGLTLAYLSAV